MKHFSKILLIPLILFILVQTTFATQARVESMGKRPAFFLDDITIFDNPANATFYSSALMGELGFFNQDKTNNLRKGINQDPYTPWFGALFQFGLSDKGMRDPELTIGGFFGREHYEFTRFVPRKVVPFGGNPVPIPQSITNFDAFLAGTMIDGSAIGAHVYVGVQDGKQDDPRSPEGGSTGEIAPNAHVSILSMDYGVNFLITNEASMEVTLGVARIQYGPSRKTFLDPGLFSFYSQGRLFVDVNALSGQFITGYKVADYEVPGWEENFYDINTGINVIIPKGLVWFGIDGVHIKEFISTWDKRTENGESFLVYNEPGSKDLDQYLKDRTDKIGGIVSFGIERNIRSNWLILRVGGQKSFIYERCYNETGKTDKAIICPVAPGSSSNYWVTNPYGDGSLNDHVGFGIGVNIDNKLKVDANIAEDAVFRNPFQGEGRLISRISAVYSF
jgi:hypothetical protein